MKVAAGPSREASRPLPSDHTLTSRRHAILARALDVVGALLLLLLLSPLLVIAAIAIKLTSRGPIFFRHTRVGRNGRLFQVWKFRSMRPNARLSEGELAAFRERFKLPQDRRITAVGRLLRKTSLDELPQLLNVLAGQMSLVGPRPVTPAELHEKYGEHAALLVSVKPGLTGLWQVSGRSSLTYEQRVELDLQYIRERSLWTDLKIILRTPVAVLLMRGAE